MAGDGGRRLLIAEGTARALASAAPNCIAETVPAGPPIQSHYLQHRSYQHPLGQRRANEPCWTGSEGPPSVRPAMVGDNAAQPK